VSKKTLAADRKARLEEVRKAQQAAERRRTMLVAGVAGLIVISLIVAVVVVIRNQLAASDLTKVGASASAASCDTIIDDAVSGSGDHVGPSTPTPKVTSVKYATVPPTSGQHFVTPESPAREFYTAKDRPKLETLVHNLEHGYTILWYDQTLKGTQLEDLKKVADLARGDEYAGPKFIVSAWDPARGKFPSGKTIALAHWGAKKGHRQFCGSVSGEVVMDFVKKFPYTDSPEPNAA
jgi:hypothetical protein